MDTRDFMRRLWVATANERTALKTGNSVKFAHLDALGGKNLLAAMPSAAKGRIGENVVANVLTAHHGLSVTNTPTHPLWDLTMAGFQCGIQVKFATENEANKFTVGGLKHSSVPHLMVLLPSATFARSNTAGYVAPRAVAMSGYDVNDALRMGTGRSATFNFVNTDLVSPSSEKSLYLAQFVTGVDEAFETLMSRLAY